MLPTRFVKEGERTVSFRKPEDIGYHFEENKKLHETIIHYEQTLLNQEQRNEQKIVGIHLDYKRKIKHIKQEIEKHKYNNGLFYRSAGAKIRH